jgi:hypothetical protein
LHNLVLYRPIEIDRFNPIMRTTSLGLLLLAAAAPASPAASVAPWPCAAHDPAGTSFGSVVVGLNTSTLAVAQKFSLYNNYVRYSDAVATADGLLLISAQSSSSSVLAYNASGLAWAFALPSPMSSAYPSTPAVARNGDIFFTASSRGVYSRPRLFSLAANGSQQWVAQLSDADSDYSYASPPTVDDASGALYLYRVPTNDAFAFSAAGTLLWETPGGGTPPTSYTLFAPSPRVGPSLVYFAGVEGSVRALDKLTGALVWARLDIVSASGDALVVHNGSLFAGGSNASNGAVAVWALDALTGATQWVFSKAAWPTDSSYSFSISGLALNAGAGTVVATTQGTAGLGSLGLQGALGLSLSGSQRWFYAPPANFAFWRGLGPPSIDAAGNVFFAYYDGGAVFSLTGAGALLSRSDFSKDTPSFGNLRIAITAPGRLHVVSFYFGILALAASPPAAAAAPARPLFYYGGLRAAIVGGVTCCALAAAAALAFKWVVAEPSTAGDKTPLLASA